MYVVVIRWTWPSVKLAMILSPVWKRTSHTSSSWSSATLSKFAIDQIETPFPWPTARSLPSGLVSKFEQPLLCCIEWNKSPVLFFQMQVDLSWLDEIIQSSWKVTQVTKPSWFTRYNSFFATISHTCTWPRLDALANSAPLTATELTWPACL